MMEGLKKSKQHDSKRGLRCGVTRKLWSSRALKAHPEPPMAHQ